MLSLFGTKAIGSGANGHNLVPPSVTYRSSAPIRVPEDYPTLQAAFDAEVVGKTWAATNIVLSGGNATMVAGSELIVGSGSASFTSEIDPDDYMFFGGQYYPVRDMQDDNNFRLWKGGNISFSLAPLLYKPTNVTIITDNDDNTLSGTIPNGVSLQIVGTDILKRWTSGTGNAVSYGYYSNFEVHNLSLIVGNGTFAQASGWATTAARGVSRASQLNVTNETAAIGFFLFAGSAVEIDKITGSHFKCNNFSDYSKITNVSHYQPTDDDALLTSIADTTNDIAYEHEIDNYYSYRNDGSIGNFSSLEWNNWSANKVANVRNSNIIAKNVTVQSGNDSYPIWLPANGVINFFDTVIDSDTVVEECFNRGATVNFNNSTFKLDGTTVPRLSP